MQLTVWTYEGPPHVGAMRIAAAMQGVHFVLHSPQGDTYADLLFTMIERSPKRPPVTYTTFQARDLGGDTARLLKQSIHDAYERFKPDVLLVASSCTAELLQDDPGGLARALELPIPVVPLELQSYQKKENWGAAEAFYQLVRAAAASRTPGSGDERGQNGPSCNILGPAALGFRHRDDLAAVTSLLESLNVRVNVVAPLGASFADLARLGEADFNVLLYPEIGGQAAQWLKRTFGQPIIDAVPIGRLATRRFIAEVAHLAGGGTPPDLERESRSEWYSRSVDSTYLTGKRVYVFGDATHAIAAARVARDELGFTVAGLGTYSREFAREVREAAASHGVEPLISEDYLAVEAEITKLAPDLVLGTQMERHIAKRLRLPCAVISSPAHVQDFPARFSPQMGFEGANVIFDTWVHPLMMGLEEHLLTMFRGDFEFNDAAPASHLGTTTAAATAAATTTATTATTVSAAADTLETLEWTTDATQELSKIPFFVRGRARRNTERFALERRLEVITLETLYDAKAHFSR
jgi:light-independent protochlorophyllide reductase subunit B